MEQIQITIDPDAQVTIEVKGHSGPSCTKLTAALQTALGETTREAKTHEYHQQSRATVRAENRG